ncbi:6934_t:CDS:1, partial [Cetraspora pellucida]
TRKKDFDLSSEKEKTFVLETEVKSILYSSKNEPSKSNTKNGKNQASNIEQEGKLAGKGKQKATFFTSEDDKTK